MRRTLPTAKTTISKVSHLKIPLCIALVPETQRLCRDYTRAMTSAVKARFFEPMLLLRTEQLPDDPLRWEYQLKLDGYRAIAFKTGGRVHLRSRNDHDFGRRYPGVARGLASLPDETVIDGELVAFDEEGRPSFNALQNGASTATVIYFVFDALMLG